MENSKFSQLCSAYDIAQDNFDQYKKNCHTFALELVSELKNTTACQTANSPFTRLKRIIILN